MATDRLPPDVFGKLLFKFLVEAQSDLLKEPFSKSLQDIRLPLQEVVAEFVAIRWLAIDFGITKAFGYGTARSALLDPFLDCIHETFPPEYEEFLGQRVCYYAGVLNNATVDPFLEIGGAFSDLLWPEENASESQLNGALVLGGTEFSSTLHFVQELLRAVEIVW